MAAADICLPVAGDADIVAARQEARLMAKRLGLGLVDQSRIATAVSELTRNVVRYATAGRGEVVIRELLVPPARRGLELVVAAAGPGFPDWAQSRRAGLDWGHGLGVGLPGPAVAGRPGWGTAEAGVCWGPCGSERASAAAKRTRKPASRKYMSSRSAMGGSSSITTTVRSGAGSATAPS